MTSVPRHPIDHELAVEGAEGALEQLAAQLDVLPANPHALDSMLSTARGYAGYLSVTTAEIDPLCGALRSGAAAAGGLFALATGNGEVEVDVESAAGRRHLRLPATGPTDATHAGNWRVGWWMAHVVRDAPTITRLARTPVEVLRRSSTRGDECQYLYAEALQAVQARQDDWGERLQQALHATDPAENDLAAEEFVLNILVPEMEMLFHLGTGEPDAFQESLAYALERHRRYWSKAARRDPDGFLALGPLAIAAMAYDAGFAIEVESGYLPVPLVEGACSA